MIKYSGKKFADMTYEVTIDSDSDVSDLVVFVNKEEVYKATFRGKSHRNMLDDALKQILVILKSDPMPKLGTWEVL